MRNRGQGIRVKGQGSKVKGQRIRDKTIVEFNTVDQVLLFILSRRKKSLSGNKHTGQVSYSLECLCSVSNKKGKTNLDLVLWSHFYVFREQNQEGVSK